MTAYGDLSVDVWTWNLDIDEALAARVSDWLTAEERKRAAAFITPQLQRRWIAARAGMRGILASVLGVAPQAPVFVLGPHGRPELAGGNSPHSFNLSHSDALAAFSVSEAAVGVDVERIKALPEGVAGMVFSKTEIAALEAAPEDARAVVFYRYWTAKEAVLKALGTGLSVSGRSFTIDISRPETPRLVSADWKDEDTQAWQLAAFRPAEGFAGAVAVRTQRPLRLNLQSWSFGE
ncbi:putative 4'-phosphopantetheinyl transferase [Hyphomonas polymorpha PS728]|uniref:Putative 4'-phosphopantetheinyl transferase n=1 Tax=Hyphomonas polymorpha PS728 TaxID=1280954 RepID=A0A062V763_9PROT|nr:4'-phosphopantetheinyl transferase superfamily protein [Hyphomonas polymorpha]KCZ97906.1 putative 4'-phosphopantetheinyl transferase [Hyphomonas polymorpha PS728]